MQSENFKGEIVHSEIFGSHKEAITGLEKELKCPDVSKVTIGNFRIGETVIVNGLQFEVKRVDAHKKRLVLRLL